MTQASLRELIAQERAAGKLDTETLVLLRRSKLKPPGGFYCWSLPALRSVMDEDAPGTCPQASRDWGLPMTCFSDHYRAWCDRELREHRHACLQVAREQALWGDRQTSMYARLCRTSADRYQREMLRRVADRVEP